MQPNQISSTKLSLVTSNIRGQINFQNALNQYINLDLSIICLQETHWDSTNATFWSQVLHKKGFQSIHSTFNTNSRGSSVLVNTKHKLTIDANKSSIDPNGFWCLVHIMHEDSPTPLRILAVYSPQAIQQQTFIKEIENIMSNEPNPIWLVGDFNNSVDKRDVPQQYMFKTNDKLFINLTDTFEMSDCWWQHHDKTSSTWFSSASIQRLSTNLFQYLLMCEDKNYTPVGIKWKVSDINDDSRTLTIDKQSAKSYISESKHRGSRGVTNKFY